MILFRRRLFVWLVKAYIKRWGKRILVFFLLGIIASYFLFGAVTNIIAKIPITKKETVGLIGAYTVDNLPPVVLGDISEGLTKVSPSGEPMPAIAKSWKVQDNGKTYIFNLKTDLHFTDGSKVTSKEINYNFTDATLSKPSDYTVVFKLKNVYSPFLVTVSRPIFKNGTIGIGPYKITDIKLNGSFVQSISLALSTDSYKIKKYTFYPTEEAVKTAFLLGEISKADLGDLSLDKTNFAKSPNLHYSKSVDYTRLVTLFYNTVDSDLSNPKLRLALTYALPDQFPQGERAASLYPPTSFAYADQFIKTRDIDHAKILMASTTSGTKLKVTIKALSRYESAAKVVANAWKDIGVDAKIELVDTVPNNFQIFLGDFSVPLDPDQYMLWHSSQDTNITNYKNLRIDKLLEDGRTTLDQEERTKIYYDFQKYLLEDAPASFLYFPNDFSISRR